MRTKSANDMRSAATATGSIKMMISPLVSKVKLAGFAGYSDCSEAEAAPLVERFLPPEY